MRPHFTPFTSTCSRTPLPFAARSVKDRCRDFAYLERFPRLYGMERTTVQHTPNNLVSRILQVALGLFVTTSDLPPLPINHELLSYDCSFDTDCRWSSVGDTMDRWRIARGEPDSLLWLAATGTMQLPREPFVLIEQRGNPVDSLMTDAIRCQKGYADLSFNYWAIGNADLEICLTDLDGHKFNCTGMLNSNVMPGKVSLKIPELQRPFRIMISPNVDTGVLVLDDIRYDASICQTEPHGLGIRGRPDFLSTAPPRKISPWTIKKTSVETTESPIRRTSTESPTTTTQSTTTTTITTTTSTTTPVPTTTTEREIQTSTDSPTEVPFDLLIHGNRTKPLFDRRNGKMIGEATRLLCDFNNEFACQWGVEAGRWAVIEKGAIPSLEDSIADPSLLPTYPAALVLQGTAMLTSDPIPCQSGPGKLLFRYWSNGDILLQVCALGHGNNSDVIHCVDQSRAMRHERNTLAVFELSRSITEPFTLNIVPQWELGLKNRFLVLDEIAYIGECKGQPKERPQPTTTTTQEPLVLGVQTTTRRIPTTTTVIEETTEATTLDPTEETTDDASEEEDYETSTTEVSTTTLAPRNKPEVKQPFTKKRPITRIIPTTFSPVFPEVYTNKPPTRGRPAIVKWNLLTTTPDPRNEDYCELLNCNFDDTACNYLNHGLTKKPWTLRNRGYGYPLTGATDIRATNTNGQFVSSILDPGDIAILESPKFNATRSLNVLLFQYFRPSQMTTIRLCLGSRYTNPMRTVNSFTQCPSILRSVTSKNAFRWNTVHVQLPPGTTHFYLVAHNSERAETRAAMAIDNMRVAICDTRGFAPDYMDENNHDFEEFVKMN
ncbi:unnamed protein product [Caenorhabditis auriculariae]|uniref:MAM domain-containing protein n=1 Tax=Caenorhabditis auriculariae TaxID=2777116 RepID=A0A8S1GRX8_9PELO|nr:unnamed protein product [Caenorhabditis auriculariae]